MPRYTLPLLVLTLGLLPSRAAYAVTTVTHSFSLTISSITEVAVTGGSVSLPITTSASATNSSTTLAWSTNAAAEKITVATNLVTIRYPLTVEPTAVSGGTGSAALTLSTTAQNLVTGISHTYGSCGLTYSASATREAGTGSDTHTVTFTITAA